MAALHLNGWFSVFQQAAADWFVAEPEAQQAAVATAEGPAVVVAEAPAWPAADPEESPAVVPVPQAPAKDNSWLRLAASMFGSRARH